jgi:hypothetical protein
MRSFTTAIDVNASRDRLVGIFSDPARLHDWHAGLVERDQLFAQPNRTSSSALLTYRQGAGRPVDVVELILRNDLPHRYEQSFGTRRMYWRCTSLFAPIEPGRARWTVTAAGPFPGPNGEAVAPFWWRWFVGPFAWRAVERTVRARMSALAALAEREAADAAA